MPKKWFKDHQEVVALKAKVAKFRDPKILTKEQLTDPDYALKKIQKEAKELRIDVTCSKCHHCR